MKVFEFRTARRDDAPRVEAFNRRLAAGGERYHRLSIEKPFRTMAHRDDAAISVDRLFCLDGGEIRGGVGVKQMGFRINGRPDQVACSVYPLSEGIINPAYNMVGLLIHAELMRRYPLKYRLASKNVNELDGSHDLPVSFHWCVLRAHPFLRNLAYLRRSVPWRLLLDVLAFSGLGTVGLKLFTKIQKLRGREPNVSNLIVQRFDRWESWADEVWAAARDSYSLVGDRSCNALQLLYPEGNPHLIKLRFLSKQTERLLGWAVVTSTLHKDHKYFGNMVLGAIVDMFALPDDCQSIVNGALHTLRSLQSDVVVVNHSDQRWNVAFDKAGMLPWKSNLFLSLSPQLRMRFHPLEDYSSRFFFTRGDGHGPTSLWMADYHSTGSNSI